MKVYTSIFVIDGARTTFEDLEVSVQFDRDGRSSLELTDGTRDRITELQAHIEITCDRPERGWA
jgi:hypothetical protein